MNANSTIRSNTDRPTGAVPGSPIGGGRSPVSRLRVANRRRGLPYLMLGVLLALACAGGFVMISVNSGDRQAVLALARDVPIGRALEMRDLREVRVAVEPGVAVVGADQVSAVVGRQVATSLSAGTLLTPDAVGRAVVPAAGQAVAALALKPGQFPPEVAAGARVSVVFVPDQAGAAGGPPADDGAVWPAVIVSVTSAVGEQITVVSVQLTETAARQVAAVVAGRLSIVMLSGGGR